jgi:hypothetical protein
VTPLAAYLAGQIVARPKHRRDVWQHPENIKRLQRNFEDAHYFEASECIPIIGELAGNFKNGGGATDSLFETYSFLPAPKTWIEWKRYDGHRIAMFCEEIDGHLSAFGSAGLIRCTAFCREMAEHAGYLSRHGGDYYDGHPGAARERSFPTYLTSLGKVTDFFPALLSFVHCCILLINSPKIIGRKQHMPNAGLERRLTSVLGAGKFPLHAWTELKLHVNKPLEIDDGEPHEAHLTGRRALHFVRKHIRIRRGQLEYVTAHWRGDPAIGIKQTRYVVQP